MPAEARGPRGVAKLVGADFELGNSVRGLDRPEGTGAEAARRLLREIEGVAALGVGGWGAWASQGAAGEWGGWDPQGTAGGWGGWDPQDRGRKFLASNGGCAYIDLDHLELCIPEVRSAFDFAAASTALLRLADAARRRADAALPSGQSLRVLANNSDGLSHSYGSHLSFLVSRALMDDLISRRPHYLHFLATHQLSSLVYAGQGKVGAENGRPAVAYQISQRADFVETLIGQQTTHQRPVVNSRDETLCADHDALARLHVIFFDHTLCPGASVLKVGAMQLVLAMLEDERLEPGLAVDDPVAAALAWSHDPGLRATARLVDGRGATALEVQQRMLALAHDHRERCGFESVPRADEILALWQDTLDKLAARDFDALLGRLDWVLKRALIERALVSGDAALWASPQARHLDQLYASVDPQEGLYWPHWASGLVERWIDEEQIQRFAVEPPEDTRAWTRAMLLRRLDAADIARVDWDRVVLRGERGVRREILLADPRRFTRSETAHLFDEATHERRTT